IATIAENHALWGCLSQVVTDFNELTEGAVPGQYSAAELKSFLEKYFFSNGLSDDTVQSTLRLKQVVVGGDESFVTKGEIQKLLLFLSDMDSATTPLVSVANVLFANANDSTSNAN